MNSLLNKESQKTLPQVSSFDILNNSQLSASPYPFAYQQISYYQSPKLANSNSPNNFLNNNSSFDENINYINDEIVRQNQTPIMNLNFDSNIEENLISNDIQVKPLETKESSKFEEIENFPRIENIVSTANLGCPLNLRIIALQAKNAEYNPRRFSAVIMKIKEPKTTASFQTAHPRYNSALSSPEFRMILLPQASQYRSSDDPACFCYDADTKRLNAEM